MAEVLIVTGPPGAGKSTVARLLAQDPPKCVHVQGDQFFLNVVRGFIPPWTDESREQNNTILRAMAATVREYARGGYAVVLEGIVGPWFLGTFRDVLAPEGVPVHYVVLRPSEDVALARAQARPADALCEEEPIRKTWRTFADLDRYPAFTRRSYESHVLDNGHQIPAETAQRIRDLLAQGHLQLEWAT